jgi:hypothetical protein
MVRSYHIVCMYTYTYHTNDVEYLEIGMVGRDGEVVARRYDRYLRKYGSTTYERPYHRYAAWKKSDTKRFIKLLLGFGFRVLIITKTIATNPQMIR